MDFIEIEIVNWEKYNPRKDRASHNWLRLEKSFFRDQKTFHLTDSQRLFFLFLLCEACEEQSGRVKLNIEYVSMLRKMTKNRIIEDLQVLAEAVTIRLPDGNQSVTNCLTTNVRTNERTGTSSQDLIHLWNTHTTATPRAKNWSSDRKKKAQGVDAVAWTEACRIIEASDFLSGRSKKWKATFDWLLNPKNLAKVLEGNYENLSSSGHAKVLHL